MDLEKELEAFLAKHHQPGGALLLAFSGGPDSLALFHLLCRYREKKALDFAVAHVDHGWRPSSSAEACQLRQLALDLNVVFHFLALSPAQLKGNLEDACRIERRRFFTSLLREYGYEALILGHHADDQAETVLKRVFEGAQLIHLQAMSAVGRLDEFPLWRPLLNVPKAVILNWNARQGLIAIEDSTNQDLRFLRARFRQQLMPQLAAEFGKALTPTLCRIGRDAAELSDYLDQQITPILVQAKEGCWGWRLDLSHCLPLPTLLCRHLIMRLCRIAGRQLSRSQLDLAVDLLHRAAAHRQLESAAGPLYIDRQQLFMPLKDLPQAGLEQPLFSGRQQWGGWQVVVEMLPAALEPVEDRLGWQSLWQEGVLKIALPPADYLLAPASNQLSYPRQAKLSKWWSEQRVPAFLRQRLPVICQQGRMVHEFMSGHRILKPLAPHQAAWQLSLRASTFNSQKVTC